MELAEVESVLGCFSTLRVPRHLVMIKEPVTEQMDGIAYFRGLQPRHRSDVIVITPQATPETVVHEVVHAQFGFGELMTYPLARAWARKYYLLRSICPPCLQKKRVEYQKCSGCEEFSLLHERYAGRAEHYFIRARKEGGVD